MAEWYDIKIRGMMGPDAGDEKEIRILNRVVKWESDKLIYEADDKHVSNILFELGFDEKTKGLDMPTAKDYDGEDEGLLPLGLRVLDDFRSFCCMKEFGDGFNSVTFPTLIHIVAETAIVSFHTLPVGFLLPKIFMNSLYTLFGSLIFDDGVLLKISFSAPNILISNFLFDTSFHHCFQSVIIRS